MRLWLLLATNIYVSIAGGALTYTAGMLQNIVPKTSHFLISFLYLFAMHNLNRFTERKVQKFNDPLRALVDLQGEYCPVPDMENIADMMIGKKGRVQVLIDLTILVESDMRIRAQAVRDFNISVASELFYFGRPLFQLFLPLDIVTTETAKGIELHYQPRG